MTTVLIADDSAFMRNLLRNILEQNGCEIVDEAADGNEAVEKYKEKKPDLAFLDIMMPNKTGLDALKEIIEYDKTAKVIMCTSVGQDKVVAEAVEAGVSEFIVKPVKAEDVRAVLEKLG